MKQAISILKVKIAEYEATGAGVKSGYLESCRRAVRFLGMVEHFGESLSLDECIKLNSARERERLDGKRATFVVVDDCIVRKEDRIPTPNQDKATILNIGGVPVEKPTIVIIDDGWGLKRNLAHMVTTEGLEYIPPPERHNHKPKLNIESCLSCKFKNECRFRAENNNNNCKYFICQ